MKNRRLRPFPGSMTVLAGWMVSSVVFAGAPPASCTAFDECVDLESDRLVFLEGDPTYEIVAQITDCSFCERDGAGYRIDGNLLIEWGPYDPGQGAICGASNDETTFMLAGTIIDPSGTGGGGERNYVPRIATAFFNPTIPTPLTTACVSASNLDYRISFIELSAAAGARTGVPGVDPNALLYLPGNVRASDASGVTSALPVPGAQLSQNLDFNVMGVADSALRVWPDGYPFRLGPYDQTFTQSLVTMTPDGTLGPPPYAGSPPDNPDLTMAQTVECDPMKPDFVTDPCSAVTVSNDGYFDSPHWSLPGSFTIGIGGLSVDLDFRANEEVVYETLFPRGVWVRLVGPGAMSIVNSEIVSGAFDDGTGWLRIRDGEPCGTVDRERTFPLRTGTHGPQIGPGGSLLAGVADLTNPLPIDWAVHQAQQLECGSLFVPPARPDQNPQASWNESAVPTTLDRGIYAGYNYNRNHVCHDAMGTPLSQFCSEDADCGAGETCLSGGFSPLCPVAGGAFIPEWDTDIEGVNKIFPIYPTQPGFGDREMAFVVRQSGVTGVFDGGDTPFNVTSRLCRQANGDWVNVACQIDAQCGAGETCQDAFSFDFDTYGLAFKQSETYGQDTIIRGQLDFDWPANTQLPFDEMSMCQCGSMDAAQTPEQPVESILEYWNASFLPYGVDFTDMLVNGDECAPNAGGSCSESGVSTAACVTALTPIARINPDPTSQFPLLPDGNTGTFLPFSGPDVDFDNDPINGQAPYDYHLESFYLNTWNSATGPAEADVVNCDPMVNPNCELYGYYDLVGDLSFPYFGLNAAGIQIRPEDRDPLDPQSEFYYPANLHEEGDPSVMPSAVAVSRAIAQDNLVSNFLVDYLPPDSTADPNDGDDRNFRGRGKLFAFADTTDLDLGVTQIAGGMIMDPAGVQHSAIDLGPAAGLRLWGATEPDSRGDLVSIITNLVNLTGQAGPYNNALAELKAEQGLDEWALPDPQTLRADLLSTGAMEFLSSHPLGTIEFNVDPNGLSPTITGSQASGWGNLMAAAPQQLEFYEISSNQSSGGDFYAVDASLVQVDRHVKQNSSPIITQTRIELPGASQNMELPGEQSIPFPSGGAAESNHFVPGMTWDYDYDMPGFTFRSLTGSLDLTKGGFSGMGFDKMGATLKFWADGDWYFDAGLKVRWSGYSIKGDILLGNTQDMTPLWSIDPDVAHFLKGIDRMEGAYLGAGLSTNIWDSGCLLEIAVGADVAGWYISDSFGGKLRGYVHGTGGCIVSIRGDLTLLGGMKGNKFKMSGKFWAGGGIGFCDPEDWNSPADVLDDDFCSACAAWGRITGTYPPSDLDLKFSGPSVECAL